MYENILYENQAIYLPNCRIPHKINDDFSLVDINLNAQRYKYQSLEKVLINKYNFFKSSTK